MRLAIRILLVVAVLCLIYPAIVLGMFFLAPRTNMANGAGKVDALVVLGCPTRKDGSPTPEMRERVLESVKEYKAGVSQHVIMTGAAAHNAFVEAHAMALLAEQNGVPAEAIVEETQATDTIQNIFYSNQILQQRGWKTAEVISSPYHLPRTRLILLHYPSLQWKEDAAQWPPEYGTWDRWQRDWREAMGGVNIRLHGFRPSKFLPQ